MKIEEKLKLTDKVSVTYNRASYLLATCEERKLTSQVAKLEERRARLRKQIDGLLGDLYDEWTGNAASLLRSVERSNRNLNAAIESVQKNVDAAKNVVKAIGFIDEVIETATNIVA